MFTIKGVDSILIYVLLKVQMARRGLMEMMVVMGIMVLFGITEVVYLHPLQV